MQARLVALSIFTLAASLFLLAGAGPCKAEPEFKGKIARSYDESEEWWAKPTRPPKGDLDRVVITLLD